MAIKVKEGVVFKEINDVYLQIFNVLKEASKVFGVEMVITSANDGKHKVDSLHYLNKALDIRTKHLPDNKTKLELKNFLQNKLGKDYDVILESLGGIQEHIHIEYDPKQKMEGKNG